MSWLWFKFCLGWHFEQSVDMGCRRACALATASSKTVLLLVRDIDSWPLQMKQTEGNGRLLLPFVSGSLLRIARLVGDYWGWFLHESDHRSIEVNKQKPAPFNFFNY